MPDDYRDIESYDVCHGPIIAAFCDKILLLVIANKALDCNMDVSCGKVVKGLILNILSGRDLFYRVEEHFFSPGCRTFSWKVHRLFSIFR